MILNYKHILLSAAILLHISQNPAMLLHPASIEEPTKTSAIDNNQKINTENYNDKQLAESNKILNENKNRYILWTAAGMTLLFAGISAGFYRYGKIRACPQCGRFFAIRIKGCVPIQKENGNNSATGSLYIIKQDCYFCGCEWFKEQHMPAKTEIDDL